MHIPDGIVPITVCVGGYATTAALTWYALRTINRQPDPQAGIPRASLLAAAFFVASWIHIPIPPASVHLVLNGLLGAILGFYAIPAILVGLFFQAVMFGHGGLTTLGLNATIIGVPALLAAALFHLRLHFGGGSRIGTAVCGFLAGASGLGLAALLLVLLLIATLPATLDAAVERAAIMALLLAHIPLMLIEGTLTALVALFLQRVRPDLLDAAAPPPQTVSS
jgi:cobalt/nickel transport system permease protein